MYWLSIIILIAVWSLRYLPVRGLEYSVSISMVSTVCALLYLGYVYNGARRYWRNTDVRSSVFFSFRNFLVSALVLSTAVGIEGATIQQAWLSKVEAYSNEGFYFSLRQEDLDHHIFEEYYEGTDQVRLRYSVAMNEDGTVIPDGGAVLYHEDGSLLAWLGYRLGELDGPVRYHYPDGQRAAELRMINGRPRALWEFWYDDGSVAAFGQAQNVDSWYYGIGTGEITRGVPTHLGVILDEFPPVEIELSSNDVFVFNDLNLPEWMEIHVR